MTETPITAARIIEDLRTYAMQYPIHERTPGRLEAGTWVRQLLTETATRRPSFAVPPISALPGLPVVADDTLPPDQWRLIDSNGEVLREGRLTYRQEGSPDD